LLQGKTHKALEKPVTGLGRNGTFNLSKLVRCQKERGKKGVLRNKLVKNGRFPHFH